jgi:hypothetical protein
LPQAKAIALARPYRQGAEWREHGGTWIEFLKRNLASDDVIAVASRDDYAPPDLAQIDIVDAPRRCL